MVVFILVYINFWSIPTLLKGWNNSCPPARPTMAILTIRHNGVLVNTSRVYNVSSGAIDLNSSSVSSGQSGYTCTVELSNLSGHTDRHTFNFSMS